MKALVTGGAGFIGSHTADALLAKGCEVTVLDSLEPPVHPERRKPSYLSEEIEFIAGDVRNPEDFRKALKGAEVVFHLAAYQDYLTDFSRFASVNGVGTSLLYEVIVNDKLPVRKVVLGSTQAVYGEGKYACAEHGVQYPSPRPLAQLEEHQWEVICPVCGKALSVIKTDEARVNPHNQYAISKYSQELYALILGKRYGIPTTALRYSIIQGPRQSLHNAYSGVLRIFTQRLMNNIAPVLYEDGQQVRDYTHVADAVAANILAMESEAADYRAYNVGGGGETTVRQYLDIINGQLGTFIEGIIDGRFRYGDTRHVLSDTSSLQSLGWQPKHSVAEIVRDYVGWAREQDHTADSSTAADTLMKQQGIIR